MWRHLAAAAALGLLAGCAAFTSETPLYDEAQGTPLYGPGPRLAVTLHEFEAADEEPDRARADFRDGRYLLTEPNVKPEATEGALSQSFHPVASMAGGFFVSQVLVTKAEERLILYDLYRTHEGRLFAYSFTCNDLSEDEQARFGLKPAPPPADAAPPAGPPNCMARSPADLEAAFALLASRQAPRGWIETRRLRSRSR